MATTALDIIKRALRLLGALATGEQPDGQEGDDALKVLNHILDQWSNEKLMSYYSVNEVFNLTANVGTYTIGASGASFITTRPVRIDTAFLRDATSGGNNDYPLEIIPNDRYEELYQKSTLATYPQYLNYVPKYPLGEIRLWPVPTGSYKLGISQWKQFTNFALISDSVSLPLGYEMALGYWLAYELAPEYGKDPEAFYKQAMDKKAKLKTVNTEVLLMECDSALLDRNSYNIYSDRP